MNTPLASFRFIVNLDASDTYLSPLQSKYVPVMAEAGFQEVSGLGAQLEVTQYAEGGRNDGLIQLPMRHSWNRIVLKRVITKDDGIWQWYLAGISQSLGARRDGSITLLNSNGESALTWFFRAGLAAKWDGPSFNSQQGAIAIESLEIAHEGIVQVSLAGLERA